MEAVTVTRVMNVAGSCTTVTVGGSVVPYVPMNVPLKFALNQFPATLVALAAWALTVWPRLSDRNAAMAAPSQAI